jgi:hypothetical protein
MVPPSWSITVLAAFSCPAICTRSPTRPRPQPQQTSRCVREARTVRGLVILVGLVVRGRWVGTRFKVAHLVAGGGE